MRYWTLLAGAVLLSACSPFEEAPTDEREVLGGNAERGRDIITRNEYGCVACHAIPGAGYREGIVGPPLSGLGKRSLIAGQLPNTPENLVGFIYDPPSLVPQTGMPDVRITLGEARDVAAYLYTLEPAS